MVTPRYRHAALRLPDDSIVIVGGLDKFGAPVTTIERFTPDAGFVNLPMTLPSNAGVVDFTTTRLADGRWLLTGGRATSDGPALDTAFIVELEVDGQVFPLATDHLAYPRAGHQATLLCDGTVLLSGGTDTQVPVERYNPPPDGRR
jgi:hypothetical protein